MAAVGLDVNNKFINVPELNGSNTFYGSQTFTGTTESTSTSTGTVVIQGGLGVQGSVFANKVWGSVWNDLVDCIEVPSTTNLEYGHCYCFDGENYYKSRGYMDDGIIGIHSDTAGFMMGNRTDKFMMKVAVAGFVLAYVDKVYPVGTPLTCDRDGQLTAIKPEDLCDNPHKVVATFWKEEPAEVWGDDNKKIRVNGRKWVKIN